MPEVQGGSSWFFRRRPWPGCSGGTCCRLSWVPPRWRPPKPESGRWPTSQGTGWTHWRGRNRLVWWQVPQVKVRSRDHEEHVDSDESTRKLLRPSVEDDHDTDYDRSESIYVRPIFGGWAGCFILFYLSLTAKVFRSLYIYIMAESVPIISVSSTFVKPFSSSSI